MPASSDPSLIAEGAEAAAEEEEEEEERMGSVGVATTRTTRRAIVIQQPGCAKLVSQPMPAVRDRFMLVKPVAVALNPTDWKYVDEGVVGSVVGCDYAGVVEAVGRRVKKKFKKGDRVYGPTHGCSRYDPELGAFTDYTLVKADVQSIIPDNVSFEAAATLGVGLITIGQGLYQHMKLATPDAPAITKAPILIYGGSTATGSLGIQFAKMYVYENW